MTPFDALSPEHPLRARISDRRAETAMNQHQVGDHCVDHGQKREPVKENNRWNGVGHAGRGVSANIWPFRSTMRSKHSGSGVCSSANYLLTDEAPLQKA